jgi:hypothetical protein
VKAGSVAERHEQHAMFAKTDDFGAHLKIEARRAHEAQFAEADIGAVGFDDEAGDARHRAHALHRRQLADLRPKGVNERSNGGSHNEGKISNAKGPNAKEGAKQETPNTKGPKAAVRRRSAERDFFGV